MNGSMPDGDVKNEALTVAGAGLADALQIAYSFGYATGHKDTVNGASDPHGTLSTAALDVLAERRHQRHKYGDAKDDGPYAQDLVSAAAFLISEDGLARPDQPEWANVLHAKHCDDRRRQLVIGTALALAEIERMDRGGVHHGAVDPRRCG